MSRCFSQRCLRLSDSNNNSASLRSVRRNARLNEAQRNSSDQPSRARVINTQLKTSGKGSAAICRVSKITKRPDGTQTPILRRLAFRALRVMNKETRQMVPSTQPHREPMPSLSKRCAASTPVIAVSAIQRITLICC